MPIETAVRRTLSIPPINRRQAMSKVLLRREVRTSEGTPRGAGPLPGRLGFISRTDSVPWPTWRVIRSRSRERRSAREPAVVFRFGGGRSTAMPPGQDGGSNSGHLTFPGNETLAARRGSSR